MNNCKSYKIIARALILTMFLLATSFRFAVVPSTGINFIVVGLICALPIFTLWFMKYNEEVKNKYFIVFIMIGLLLLTNLLHYSQIRFMSFIYSIMFIVSFMSYDVLLNKHSLNLSQFMCFLRFLIYIYCFVLIIQQIMSISGSSYIFNYLQSYKLGNKLNSLAIEASHAARILTVIFYTYICLREAVLHHKYSKNDMKVDIYIWISYIYFAISIQSTLALLLLLVILFKFISIKNLLIFGVAIVIFYIWLSSFHFVALDRLNVTIIATLSLDINTIIEADHSASIRIVPTLLYFKNFDIFSGVTWFGHGMDYASNYIPTVMPGIKEGGFKAGTLPVILFNNGLLFFISIVCFLFRFSIEKKDGLNMVIVFFSIIMMPFNSQVFWFSVVILSTKKYFIKGITYNLYKKQLVVCKKR